MRLNDSVTLREIASEAREKAMFDRMERMEKQMETLTTILHELRSERRVTQEERMRVGGWHQVPIVQGEVKPLGDLVVREVTYLCGENFIEKESSPR